MVDPCYDRSEGVLGRENSYFLHCSDILEPQLQPFLPVLWSPERLALKRMPELLKISQLGILSNQYLSKLNDLFTLT